MGKKNKSYSEWVDEYPQYVVLRKEGWLFRAKNECAHILSSVTGYRIIERDNGDEETGARKEKLQNMVDALIENHINYVVIHFDNVIDIYDKFGEDTEIKKVGPDCYRTTVDVQLSPTFFGWLFQFAGDIKLISPASAIEQYLKHAEKVWTTIGDM